MLIPIGYALPWTGFGQTKVAQDVQPSKTLWDWLDLLVVPVVLALGGYLFNRSENLRSQKIADERRQDDRLQAYLDEMSELLADKDRSLHRAQVGDSLSTVARARTLTVLSELDGNRKRSALQFLYESGLIVARHTVVDLRGADLSRAHLRRANLIGAQLGSANLTSANLSGSFLIEADFGSADLKSANLSEAFLSKADLIATELSGTDLRGALLDEADLTLADLSGADLRGADLKSANLIKADLRKADLRDADLSGANLRGAEGVIEEIRAQAVSLEGATVPDGQQYEDWIKDKEGSGKDVENE